MLAARILAVKRYQHERFSRTYEDISQAPRYAPATRFFLEDLYGPNDFALRDAQFARIVPALVRLFPSEIVATVVDLSALHALSERLDMQMACAMNDDGGPISPAAYAAAWCEVGQIAQRERQINLMLEVGAALDRHTRSLLLRNTLRLMRRPAQAAGLGALQTFLERGFDSFRTMDGASDFLSLINRREMALAKQLFEGCVGKEHREQAGARLAKNTRGPALQ